MEALTEPLELSPSDRGGFQTFDVTQKSWERELHRPSGIGMGPANRNGPSRDEGNPDKENPMRAKSIAAVTLMIAS